MDKWYTIITNYCQTLPKNQLSQDAHTNTINTHIILAVMTPNIIPWTISWHAVDVDVMGLFIKRSSICARLLCLPPSWSPNRRRERNMRRKRTSPYGGNLLRWCTTSEKNTAQREEPLWRTALSFIMLEKLESTWQIPLISSDFHQRFRTAKEDSRIISECLYGFGAELVMA